MYKSLRKLFFLFDAEKVHGGVMAGLRLFYSLPFGKQFLSKNFGTTNNGHPVHLWGLQFPNPIGLAAGFDKNADYIDPLACLGFGFIEIGTVTPKPQPGNPQPRLFRLPADKGIINRMGFNNEGVVHAARNLKQKRERIIIGGNIGKNKDTPLELAYRDYEICFRELYTVVDYFVVNVSSPNTPGLRQLQEREPLTYLLKSLLVLNEQLGRPKPILLKIAPDLTDAQLDEIIDIVTTLHVHGIIATNTTISRDGLVADAQQLNNIGAGGLSGQPLSKRSTEVVRYICQKSWGKIPVIAVGGIFTAADAQEKLDAGASLVQVYTGFIYEGPAIVKNICDQLM